MVHTQHKIQIVVNGATHIVINVMERHNLTVLNAWLIIIQYLLKVKINVPKMIVVTV